MVKVGHYSERQREPRRTPSEEFLNETLTRDDLEEDDANLEAPWWADEYGEWGDDEALVVPPQALGAYTWSERDDLQIDAYIHAVQMCETMVELLQELERIHAEIRAPPTGSGKSADAWAATPPLEILLRKRDVVTCRLLECGVTPDGLANAFLPEVLDDEAFRTTLRNTHDEAMLRVVEAGMKAILGSPAAPNSLRDAVARWL